nr:phage tail sheath N-terminal beta-sandwich domain-containing protein [uncultured Caproiciproducens sp.]
MITAILPGTNVEVVAGERAAAASVTGVVTIPLMLSWGDILTKIYKGDDALTKLGYKLSDVKMKLVNEVMNYADELLLYRLNTGEKATGTLAAGITVTAKYGGIRGNDLKVTVTASDTNWIIKTFLDTAEIDSQIVADESNFVANDFITIIGSGTLASATVILTGGADGTEDAGAIDAYLTEIEKHDYNVLAYTGTDSAEIAKIITFTNEQVANDKDACAVVSGTSANNKFIYNSTIGGVNAAYSLSAPEAAATMAGIIAKQGIAGSCTYFDVIGWTDVATRLTKAQQEARTQVGEMLFVYKYGGVKVLYDINSLTTYTTENPEDFHKGLVIRTLTRYASELQKLLDTKAIGKIRRTVSGKNQIKGMIADMTTVNYLNKKYIDGFTADDITIVDGASRDAIIVTVGILVADTVDKINVTVKAL